MLLEIGLLKKEKKNRQTKEKKSKKKKKKEKKKVWAIPIFISTAKDVKL